MKHEAGAIRGPPQEILEGRVFDLVSVAALFTYEQNAVVGAADVPARRKDIPALDFVEKAVLDEKLQRTVDCRRRDLFAFDFGELVDDRVGAERVRAIAEDREHAAPQRRELQAAARADGFDLFRPAIRVLPVRRCFHGNRPLAPL